MQRSNLCSVCREIASSGSGMKVSEVSSDTASLTLFLHESYRPRPRILFVSLTVYSSLVVFREQPYHTLDEYFNSCNKK
jgi:hypothetical protein